MKIILDERRPLKDILSMEELKKVYSGGQQSGRNYERSSINRQSSQKSLRSFSSLYILYPVRKIVKAFFCGETSQGVFSALKSAKRYSLHRRLSGLLGIEDRRYFLYRRQEVFSVQKTGCPLCLEACIDDCKVFSCEFYSEPRHQNIRGGLFTEDCQEAF